MQVGPNTIVTMEYTLRLDSGEVVDSSEGKEPLTFAYGQEQIIPGLERGLAGLQPGEQKEIRVDVEEATARAASTPFRKSRWIAFPKTSRRPSVCS